MSMFRRNSRLLASLGLFGLLAASGLGNPAAWAEQTITSSKDPLQVKLNTGLSTLKSKAGDPFEALLTDSYRYGEHVLPAGTVFRGVVSARRESWSLALPGYITLDVREAALPSGESLRFDESDRIKSKKVMHAKARTQKKLTKSALPFSLVTAADGIPLKYGAGFSTLQILPISLAARVTLGMMMQSYERQHRPEDAPQKPLQTDLGYGALRGTGLTGAYYLIHPSPNPDLSEGAVIPLRFEEKQLAKLFGGGQHVSSASSTQAEQPLEVIEREDQEFSQVSGKVLPNPQNQAAE